MTTEAAFDCTGSLSCTLAVGIWPGTYEVTYTATVDADATGSVGNQVVATGGGDEPPVCTDCSTDHPVEAPTITVVKSADPASGTEAAPGDTLTYTLSVEIETSNLTQVLTLADTLGTGLTFGSVTGMTPDAAFDCTGSLSCTLAVGKAPGTYEVTYTATVDAD